MMNLAFALLLSLSPAQAGSLAGVSMPDSVTVGSDSCVLNGLGLREKYFIDIYVGGLYLKSKTTSASAAINNDEPKRIEMAFIYSQVTKEQLGDSYVEGIAKLSNKAAVMDRFTKLNGMMETVVSGDRIAFDYTPGAGTTVFVKGNKKGTIEGADFMRALWSVYLGTAPPTAKLKRGMMGQ